MNHKILAAVCGVALAIATTVALAQANKPAAPKDLSSEIEALKEQNDKILEKQDDILKQLGEIKQDLNVLRRRTS